MQTRQRILPTIRRRGSTFSRNLMLHLPLVEGEGIIITRGEQRVIRFRLYRSMSFSDLRRGLIPWRGSGHLHRVVLKGKAAPEELWMSMWRVLLRLLVRERRGRGRKEKLMRGIERRTARGIGRGIKIKSGVGNIGIGRGRGIGRGTGEIGIDGRVEVIDLGSGSGREIEIAIGIVLVIVKESGRRTRTNRRRRTELGIKTRRRIEARIRIGIIIVSDMIPNGATSGLICGISRFQQQWRNPHRRRQPQRRRRRRSSMTKPR